MRNLNKLFYCVVYLFWLKKLLLEKFNYPINIKIQIASFPYVIVVNYLGQFIITISLITSDKTTNKV